MNFLRQKWRFPIFAKTCFCVIFDQCFKKCQNGNTMRHEMISLEKNEECNWMEYR